MLVNGIIGWTIHFLPKEVKAQMAEAFNFPDGSDRAKVWEIERSAFALTAWAAFITTSLWWVTLVKREGGKKGKIGKEL